MSILKARMSALYSVFILAGLISGPVFADCYQDAYKLLERENKKCYAAFGRNGEKDRTGWKKCKYTAKGKYQDARAKCR